MEPQCSISASNLGVAKNVTFQMGGCIMEKKFQMFEGVHLFLYDMKLRSILRGTYSKCALCGPRVPRQACSRFLSNLRFDVFKFEYIDLWKYLQLLSFEHNFVGVINKIELLGLQAVNYPLNSVTLIVP